MKSQRLKSAYAACREIQKREGKNYFFATRLFPEDLRLATHALYAFFRVPDDIVDREQAKSSDARAALDDWEKKWKQALQGDEHQPDVLVAAADVFRKHDIPEAYAEAFFAAMKQDTWKTEYENYEELKDYMYGSAAAVGLMMTRVIGCERQGVPYAEKLGYAMQLTNFLRDIREDLDERGRVYMPKDELRRFGLSTDDLRRGAVTDEFRAFMKFQIERADRLYDEANEGIRFLHKRGRFAVRAASDLYRAIQRHIEMNDYDVFSKRAGTHALEKACITCRAYFLI